MQSTKKEWAETAALYAMPCHAMQMMTFSIARLATHKKFPLMLN